jgi:Fe2+ transport system protein FeoA
MSSPEPPPLTALSLLAPGEKGRIAAIQLAPDLRQRLLELGLNRGVECTVIRLAPLGDPMELRVRGYHLSLRKAEAQGVLVERI